MDHIDTISKVVDETEKETILQEQLTSPNVLKSSATSGSENGGIQAEALDGTNEITLAVVNETQIPEKNQATSRSRWQLTQNPGRRDSILRKVHSEPSLTQSGLKKVLYFDNQAFNTTDKHEGSKRKSFADVVTEIIQDPIKCDIHPYGRGPLYSKVLGGEQTIIHSEEGKPFMWVLATLIILGLAVGVIVMSQMYRAKQLHISVLNGTNMNSTYERG